MLASSVGERRGSNGSVSAARGFATEEVGSAGYLARHNRQMFEDGRSFSGNERDKLFFNRGNGTFADISDLSGCDSPNDGRAAIACDFDDDGDVDLFVHELQRERHALYRNELGAGYGGFLKLRLRATSGQWEAVGATVIVRFRADEGGAEGICAQVLSRGSGFLSSQPAELIFGLGEAERATVEVRWPGGALESFGELAADTRALLVEGSGEPQALAARTTRLPDPLPLGLRVAEGEVLPPFVALSARGRETVVDPLKLAGGKRLYLNLWASYCAPCVAELPLLQELHERGEVAVAALSMDAPADLVDARRLFERRGARFPGYFLGAKASEGSEAVAVESLLDLERLPIPTTLVLEPDGRIAEIIRGPLRD